MSNKVEKNTIFILHRYFIWANRMRTYFYEILSKSKNNEDKKIRDIELMMYMSLWYGLLYVVIEGWRKLGLKDYKVDELLKSSNVDLLRKYRNGVFHYPKKQKYNDERFESFYEQETTVEWVRQLNSEFGRFFLNTIREN